jgi:hypothetical protein
MSKRKPAGASKRSVSNRKPAAASKRSRPKVTARAQRNKQAFVRSPKGNPLRSVSEARTESPLEVLDELKEESPIVEKRVVALQDDFTQKKGFDFSLPIANMQAYQAKLLEVTSANMQFAMEFSQRLARTRSPFEFLAVLAEFAGRRLIIVAKHSKELAAYSFWRIDIRSLTTPPNSFCLPKV